MAPLSEDTIARNLHKQAKPRTAIFMTEEVLAEYSGYFRLAGGDIIAVATSGSELLVQLPGQPGLRLLPEDKDKFFHKKLFFQMVFERNTNNQIVRVILHKSGFAEPAIRVSKEEGEAYLAELAARIKDKIPFPNSEHMLRQFIEEARAGIVDDTKLGLQFAHVSRDFAEPLKKELEPYGNVTQVRFGGVNAVGWDTYEVTFEKGRQAWEIRFDQRGKIECTSSRPIPWIRHHTNWIQRVVGQLLTLRSKERRNKRGVPQLRR